VTQRPVEVAGGQECFKGHDFDQQLFCRYCGKSLETFVEYGEACPPLLPTPLTSCPFTWKDQWWWLDYQIDLAAGVLQEENFHLFYKHLKEMHQIWRCQDAALSSRIRPRWIASSHDLRKA